MNPGNRGVILNCERASQLRDFSGLRFGTITPTDIDGSMDFAGRLFVFMEAKCLGTAIERGQRRHLEYQCLSHWHSGHPSLALVLEHDTPPDRPIPFHSCNVVEFFTDGRWGWRKPAHAIRCREAIDRWLAQQNWMVA